MCFTCQKIKTDAGCLIQFIRVTRCAKRHQCSFCGYTTSRPANMKKHIRLHTGERPFQCTICVKSFNEKAHLNSHMITSLGRTSFQMPNV
ncbi:hypothetical protein CEXT_484371 [Caerostris extrusa]|uniref:C2H2-type domain-containing protein n=1 Tax=Caerostris extrusa TaxID=172846 RepID=A0AAV4Y6Q2_CAEEX|nr:hypothetical protein CEXT_484371 [Caerostris extrusa]